MPATDAWDGTLIVSGNAAYVAAAAFDAPTPGTYRVAVSGPAGRVAVGPALGELLRELGGWIAGAVVGLLVGILGLVLLIGGLVRRKRPRRTAWSAYLYGR